MKINGERIKQSWTIVGAPIFIDCQFMPDSANALRLLFAHLRNHFAIPVFGPDRGKAYCTTVADMVKAKPSDGTCYRIPKAHLFNLDMDSSLETFVAETRVARASVDIILDLEDLPSKYPDESFVATIGRINSFPHLGEWRSLIVLAGSFPLTLTGMTTQTRMIRRHDWLTWQRLISSKKLQRNPVYGDYGIQHPSAQPAPVMGKANVRYTLAEDWKVFRGSDTMKRGSETRDYAPQMKPLCKLVCADSAFCSSDFSPGDQYIYEVANDEVAPSNDASRWKSVGFSHHLTYAAKQLRGVA